MRSSAALCNGLAPRMKRGALLNIERIEEILSEQRGFVDQQSQSWASAQAPADLYHYTSAEGLVGIITSGTLWASDMLSLNDTSEAEYAWNLTGQILDEYNADVPEQHRHRFKTQLREYMFRRYTPFVACFCQNGDLLSQWRGYGGGGRDSP